LPAAVVTVLSPCHADAQGASNVGYRHAFRGRTCLKPTLGATEAIRNRFG